MRGKKSKETENKIIVSIYVDGDFVQAVDKLAEKLGLSRSQMFRNLAMVGFDDAKALDALGLLTLVRKVETFWMAKGLISNEEQTA